MPTSNMLKGSYLRGQGELLKEKSHGMESLSLDFELASNFPRIAETWQMVLFVRQHFSYRH